MNVDFSKAPAWVKGHGLMVTGFGIEEVWFDENQYLPINGDPNFGPYPYGGVDAPHRHNSTRKAISFETLKPESWAGEGKPPAGTVCEWHPNVHGWVEVTILGHDGEDTWYRVKGEDHTQTCRNMAFFRPIRTPEQIATEEREAAIQRMLAACPYPGSHDGVARLYTEALYDAGYRKQSAP